MCCKYGKWAVYPRVPQGPEQTVELSILCFPRNHGFKRIVCQPRSPCLVDERVCQSNTFSCHTSTPPLPWFSPHLYNILLSLCCHVTPQPTLPIHVNTPLNLKRLYSFCLQRQNGIFKNIMLLCPDLCSKQGNSLSAVNDFCSIFIPTSPYILRSWHLQTEVKQQQTEKGSGGKIWENNRHHSWHLSEATGRKALTSLTWLDLQ